MRAAGALDRGGGRDELSGSRPFTDRTGIDAFSSSLTAAALRFADCVTPNPLEILPCIQGVQRAIVADITGPSGDDELYLRYVHIYPEGASVNGEYAVADALAIAACVT